MQFVVKIKLALFLGFLSCLGAAEERKSIQEHAYLFVVDPETRKLAVKESEGNYEVFHCAVPADQLPGKAIASHFAQQVKASFEHEALILAGRIECTNAKPTLLEWLFSGAWLRHQEATPLQKQIARFYLLATSSKQDIENLIWLDIPNILETAGQPGVRSIEPPVAMDVLGLLHKFNGGNQMFSADAHALGAHFQEKCVSVKPEIFIPSAFIEKYYDEATHINREKEGIMTTRAKNKEEFESVLYALAAPLVIYTLCTRR